MLLNAQIDENVNVHTNQHTLFPVLNGVTQFVNIAACVYDVHDEQIRLFPS